MITINTNTDVLLLPIIDTYYLHNFDNRFSDYFYGKEEIDYHLDNSIELLNNLTMDNIEDNKIVNKKLVTDETDGNDFFEVDYESYETELIEILNSYFVSDLIEKINNQFDNIIISCDVCTILDKPREYNFKTDSTNIKLNFDSGKIDNLFQFVETNIIDNSKEYEYFSKFLKDNYSSYDGFMSFVENNIDGFMSEARQIDKVEFDILIGIIYHYLISNNSLANIENSIQNLKESFFECVYENTYFSEFTTINSDFCYSVDKLKEIISTKECLIPFFIDS